MTIYYDFVFLIKKKGVFFENAVHKIVLESSPENMGMRTMLLQVWLDWKA